MIEDEVGRSRHVDGGGREGAPRWVRGSQRGVGRVTEPPWADPFAADAFRSDHSGLSSGVPLTVQFPLPASMSSQNAKAFVDTWTIRSSSEAIASPGIEAAASIR